MTSRCSASRTIQVRDSTKAGKDTGEDFFLGGSGALLFQPADLEVDHVRIQWFDASRPEN
jgi:hypothetical protein